MSSWWWRGCHPSWVGWVLFYAKRWQKRLLMKGILILEGWLVWWWSHKLQVIPKYIETGASFTDCVLSPFSGYPVPSSRCRWGWDTLISTTEIASYYHCMFLVFGKEVGLVAYNRSFFSSTRPTFTYRYKTYKTSIPSIPTVAIGMQGNSTL